MTLLVPTMSCFFYFYFLKWHFIYFIVIAAYNDKHGRKVGNGPDRQGHNGLIALDILHVHERAGKERKEDDKDNVDGCTPSECVSCVKFLKILFGAKRHTFS